jgi:mono/diheme cytochrome c family protein
MKRLLLCLVAGVLFSCKNDNSKTSAVFSPEILKSQIFVIDAGRDTSIETLHGSIIKIVAGSFSVSGSINIEIKEALTPTEIFAAGLSTESNGRLLKSGGMMYINGKSKGEPVTLVKPIKISIPNQYFDSSMRVFKGEETDSGTINWTDPQVLDTTDQSVQWQNGKMLFQAKCASCHSIFRDRTGPAMKDVEYRGPWTNRKNIYSFVRNPGKFMAGSRYAQNLKLKFGSMMTGFPDFSDEAMDAMLMYINNESKRPGAQEEEARYRDSISKTNQFPDTNKYSEDYLLDSISFEKKCGEDTFYLPVPKSNTVFFENDTTNSSPITSNTIDTVPAKAESLEGLRRGFTDPNPTSGMYDFEIRTFGWYNVDAYVEGYAGSTNVKLWVQLQVEFDISMHVYLFCPRNKMLSVMNDKKDGKFFFNKINEGIPLFLHDRAILFAFGSKGQKMYYGIKEFRIQGEQTIEVKVKETTEKEIKKAIHSKKIEGIELGVEEKEMKIIEKPCDDSSRAINEIVLK